MTLRARIADDGSITLVNHLGIDLGQDPETVLRRIETGDFSEDSIIDDPHFHCSDPDYQIHVRDVEADTPARCNAGPRRLYEAAGSGGKVMLFAVRLDSFPRNEQ
jgi:D-lactate dehydrogenase